MPKLPTHLAEIIRENVVQPESLLARARTSHLAGQHDTAIRLWLQVLASQPLNADVMIELGIALAECARPKPALFQFENALRIDPSRIDGWLHRGAALSDLGEFDEALASFERAIELAPESLAGHHYRAITLLRLGRYTEAHKVSVQLTSILPNDAHIANTHASILQWYGQTNEAAVEFDRALMLQPDLHEAMMNKAALSLLLGDLPLGFRCNEARWTHLEKLVSPHLLTAPLWLGESSLAGKTLLIYWEQGFGDTIQFCRYAALAKEEGARVIVDVQRPLASLMRTVPGVSQVVTDNEPLPAHDLRCPVMSLPLAFATTMATIPAKVPYLRADSTRSASWRERLASLRGRRIGLVWGTGSRIGLAHFVALEQRKSIPLMALEALTRVDGCSFVSIQIGPAATQMASLPDGMILHDPTADLHDFADTAALMENLDLIISVCTSTAHLAGALGKPVWLLNRFDTDWRWFLDREDSPWYPTMRIFRQPTPGDWTSVIARVANELRAFAAA